MKTKELKRIVKEWGFTISCSFEYYTIKNSFGEYVARVNRTVMYQINTNFYTWDCLDENVKRKFFDKMVEYAKTPINEREEEKYFYEHKFIKTRGGNPTYLAIRQRPNYKYPILQGSYKDIFEYKVEFTDKEMEEAKNKYWICLDDFVKKSIIEVEE